MARVNWRIAAIAAVWLALSLCGLAYLAKYKGTAGEPGAAPVRWPADTALELAASEPTLVMLAHPRCVCTRASLAELSELVSDAAMRVRTHVVFIRPEGVGDDWMETDLLERAQSIPNSAVHEDAGGREAALFGAATSGQVLVYAPDGTRLFQGGITGARGHLGENAGRLGALASVKSGDASPDTNVFGCALKDKQPQFAVEDGR